MKSKKKLWELKAIARERVSLLLEMAFSMVKRNEIALARRYVEIALRIASKTRLKLPRSIKRSYCRRCFVPLIPGITLTVRLKSEGRGSRIVYRCLLCGWTRRFMIKTSRVGSERG